MIVGVDPGATGGVAVLNREGRLVAVHDMPYLDGAVSAPLLAQLLRDVDTIAAAWVERAQAMPRGGVSGMFRYGTGYGVILGVLGALAIQTETVRPVAWKKSVGLGGTGKDKAASRRRAIELWPDFADAFARVKDDGRAEAALIARHGWLTLNGVAA